MTLEKFKELEELERRMRNLKRMLAEKDRASFSRFASDVLDVDPILRQSFIALAEGQLRELEEAFANA